MGKSFYVFSFVALLILAACGKDDTAASTPQAVPTTGTPAPTPPPQPTQPAPPPAPGPGPGNQGQNGSECFCDYWGCYTCGADDWCCEVNTCNGFNQQRIGNYFSRTNRY